MGIDPRRVQSPLAAGVILLTAVLPSCATRQRVELPDFLPRDGQTPPWVRLPTVDGCELNEIEVCLLGRADRARNHNIKRAAHAVFADARGVDRTIDVFLMEFNSDGDAAGFFRTERDDLSDPEGENLGDEGYSGHRILEFISGRSVVRCYYNGLKGDAYGPMWVLASYIADRMTESEYRNR